MVYQLTGRSSPTGSLGCCSGRAPSHVVGFPENRLLNSAPLIGMRPIITRTERVAVNIADGFARATNGERLLPCVTQYAPGAEAAFGAVAQAYGDRSPILLCPTEYAVAEQDAGPELPDRARRTGRSPAWRRRSTTRRAAPRSFRRALNALRGVRNGPVLVALANDVMNGDARRRRLGAGLDRGRACRRPRRRTSSRPRRMLAGATSPVILAGQGVLYARRHRRAGRARRAHRHARCHHAQRQERLPREPPAVARHRRADAAGRRRPLLRAGRPDPRRRHELHPVALHHAAARRRDAGPDRERPARPRLPATTIDFGCVGDARLVLRQLLGSWPADGPGGDRRTPRWPPPARRSWRRGCRACTSDAAPLSPYRIVWELMQAVDRTRTVVTHDAGHPRDQIVPFYETLVPRGYLGWGKSTQLGTGLGLAHGRQARAAGLARPSTSWATPPSAWSAWTSRPPSAPASRS